MGLNKQATASASKQKEGVSVIDDKMQTTNKPPKESANFLSVSNINKDTSKNEDSSAALNDMAKSEFKSAKIVKETKKANSFKAKQMNLQSQRISNMKDIKERSQKEAENDELEQIISQSIKGHTN